MTGEKKYGHNDETIIDKWGVFFFSSKILLFECGVWCFDFLLKMLVATCQKQINLAMSILWDKVILK